MNGCDTLPKYVSKSVKNGVTFYRLRKSYKKKEYQLVQHPQLEYVLSCREQCEKVGWKKEEVIQLKEKFNDEKPLYHDGQYIFPDEKGGWRIRKWDNGRVKYYGKAHTFEEAKRIRDYLIRHNWKKPVLMKRKVSPNKYLSRTSSGLYRIHYRGEYYGTYPYTAAIMRRNYFIDNGWSKENIEYVRGHSNPNRYIACDNRNGIWVINKVVDGVRVSFGTWHSLDMARRERDFWESINWDFDLLDLH